MWIDLEIIILSEVSQKEQDKYHKTYDITYVASKTWYKWTYLENRNRLTGIENRTMVVKVKGGERNGSGVWDQQM